MIHFSSSQESHKVGSAGGVNEERKHRGIRHLPKSQTNKHVELGPELTSWSCHERQEISHIHLNKLIFLSIKEQFLLLSVSNKPQQWSTFKLQEQTYSIHAGFNFSTSFSLFHGLICHYSQPQFQSYLFQNMHFIFLLSPFPYLGCWALFANP